MDLKSPPAQHSWGLKHQSSLQALLGLCMQLLGLGEGGQRPGIVTAAMGCVFVLEWSAAWQEFGTALLGQASGLKINARITETSCTAGVTAQPMTRLLPRDVC